MLVENEHLSLWTFVKLQICPRREKWVFAIITSFASVANGRARDLWDSL
jgi:hypothetical protein